MEDRFSGYGIYHYPDGARYEGKWFEDKRHGAGKIIEKDGTVILGDWIMGEKT